MSRRDATSSPCQQTVEFRDDTFVIDAALIGELLHLPPSQVQMLMRSGMITSACERGFDEHAGEFRLSFFYGNRRARVCTDLEGRILRRSAIDFGDRPIPGAGQRTVAGDEGRSKQSANKRSSSDPGRTAVTGQPTMASDCRALGAR